MTTVTPVTPHRRNSKPHIGDRDEDLCPDSFNSNSQSPRSIMNNASPGHGRSRPGLVVKAETHFPPTPQRNVGDGLRAWSESPTSTPQRATSGARRADERENWDDDFLDSTNSPAKPSTSTPIEHHIQGVQRSRAYEDSEEENWDEDFELGMTTSRPGAGPSTRSKKSRRGRQRGPKWDTSDDEMDFDREMGFDRNDEEDKTVTSRSRKRPLNSLSNEVGALPPLPPLPPLPTFLPTIPSGDVPGPYASPPSPFPRSSPTHSVFSIPATTSTSQRDRDSTYGSTAHLALSLRRTHSAESSPSSPLQKKFINPNRFPHGTEVPRERRRLRKKSRPPHLDSSILELDDKAVEEPTFHRPSTPESRPCTPPPSSSPGAVLLPMTPSAPTHSTANQPVPTSPTSASKSPLLARIGSIRRWGRKRANTTTGSDSVSVENPEPNVHSPTDGAPPSAFPSKVFDAEADRHDNNRTPRPRSHITRPQDPPLSTLPVLQPSEQGSGPPQTPSRTRFFRGSSSGLDANAPAEARSSLAIQRRDMSRGKSKERERERLRLAIPQAVPMAPQSSQSGDSEAGLTTSPRKHRVRALGHKLLPAKRSISTSSPERGKDSSDGGSSQISVKAAGHRAPSAPLSGETPTRLRPRITSSRQGLSSHGRARHVVPRSVSGSAVKERSHSPLSPSMSASGRSVSASGSTGTAPSSEDLAHSEKGSDEKAGYRGFMGSLRRISLVTAHAQHQRQQQSADNHSARQSPVPAVPPLPRSPHEPVPSSSKRPTSPNQLNEAPASVKTSAFESMHVDLSYPTSGQSSDWPITGNPRRSGDTPALTHSKSSSFATSTSHSQSASGSRLSSNSQVASLGRTSPLPVVSGSSGNSNANGSTNVPRRNSLGDLKIPSRISKAQDGLKRDLGRVREFATRVEQMQDLRASYFAIAAQIQSILDSPRPPSRATSPTGSLFGLSRSNSRARPKANLPPVPAIDYKGLALGFQTIDTKYSVAWECADLLIELGTGNVADPSARSVPTVVTENKGRERAKSLRSDEEKPDVSQAAISSPGSLPNGSPPPIVSWRTSTVRNDMGHRQLYLLKEMLNNAESLKNGAQLDIPDIPHWAESDEAMDSTLTLPTDESAATNPAPGTAQKKRKASRLIGIRDMLRSLKRSAARAVQSHSEGIIAQSTTTLSTESSFDCNGRQVDSHPYGYNTVAGPPLHAAYGRRKSETSTALIESMHSPNQEYGPFTDKLALSHKSSPRRPSLASLFRLGQKHKGGSVPLDSPSRSAERTDPPLNVSSGAIGEDEEHRVDVPLDDIDDSDWDRIDSISDVDVQLAAIADESSGRGSTMKLRKKKLQNRLSMPPTGLINLKHHTASHNSSQLSFATPDPSLTNIHSARLSNVDENDISMSSTGSDALSGLQMPESTRRPSSRAGRKDKTSEKPFSSVRTAPPEPSRGLPSFDAPPPVPLVSNLKLAMTPENIKPLLENARVVTARLHDCISEVKGLLIRTEGAAFTLSPSATSSKVALT